MELTEQDKKRIGKNVKHIRKANGLNTDEFATLLQISQPQLEHIENGSYRISDDTLLRLSKISGFSSNDIKYQDLSFMEKNSLNFGENVNFSIAVDESGILDMYIEIFRKYFPFIKDETFLSSSNYSSGLKIADGKLSKLVFNEEDAVSAIAFFEQAFYEDGTEASCVNILSCIGYYYIAFVNNPLAEQNPEDLKKLDSIESDHYASMLSGLEDVINLEKNRKKVEERRQVFFKKYREQMLLYMRILNDSGKYKDFLFFFIAIRYSIKMFSSDETKMTELEMSLFGESLMKCLVDVGNVYAVDLQNYIDEIKNINL